MELIQTLRTILHNDYIAEVKQAGFFTLEDGLNHSSTVKYRPEKEFLPCVFDIDNSNKAIFHFFDASVKGVTRVCDYILFFEKKPKRKGGKSKAFVFLLELKSSRGAENKQLEAAHIFAEFLANTAKRMLKFKPFDVEYRGIVISNAQSLRFKTNFKNENYVRLENSGLKQMRLRSGSNLILELLAK
jgi:hypothetical protein